MTTSTLTVNEILRKHKSAPLNETVCENLTANIAGGIKHKVVDGKSYLVAPLSLIVPGVLAGSKGPLYYPAEEVQNGYEAWEQIPLVVYHPVRDGQNVSAQHPGVIEKQGIGFVKNAHISKQGKLRGYGYFDVEKTKQVDARIYDRLVAGDPIELSTGLFTTNEPAPQGSNHNGKPYSFIARNYRPDHLAILPDQVGACSLHDGCGVLVNSVSINSQFPFLLTNGGPGSGPKKKSQSAITSVLYTGSYKDHGQSYQDNTYLTSDKKVAKQYGEFVRPVKITVSKVFSPKSVSDVEQASGIARAADTAFVFDELDRPKVREALKKKGYHAVQFTDVAPNSDGSKTHDAVLVFNPKRIRKKKPSATTATTNSLHDGCGVLVNQEQQTMVMTQNGGPGSGPQASGKSKSPTKKKSKITIDQASKVLEAKGMKLGAGSFDMKTMSTSYKVTDKHGKETTMTTDEIKKLVSNESPIPEPSGSHFEGEPDMALTVNERSVLVGALIANCDCYRNLGESVLNGLPDEKLLAVAQAEEDKLTANAEEEELDEEEEEEEEDETPATNGKMPPQFAKKKKKVSKEEDDAEDVADGGDDEEMETNSAEKWFRMAPPAVRSAVQNAMRIEAREKQTIVEQLTANVRGAERKRITANLMSKSLSDLEDLKSLIPTTNSFQEESHAAPNYFGAAVGRDRSMVSNRVAREDVLDLPVFNWTEIAKAN